MLLSGTDTHPAGLGTMAGNADENQKGRPGYEAFLSDRVVSVATLLQGAGYHTYMAGKWHLGMEEGQGPHRRGFERSFALLPGGASHFSDAAGLVENRPLARYREDGRDVSLDAGFYSTSRYTDTLIEYIRGGLADRRPFFAYAAYTSPHWPLQVPDAELDRYRGAYDEGYDVLRARRFDKALSLGIVPRGTAPPPRTPFARAWQELSPDQKLRQARAMEIYAAMVEDLDHHVGRLLQFLKDAGQYDDTFVLFFSDNGAEGNPIDRMETNASWIPRRFDNALANLGRANSYAWLGPGWAQAATPFRLWKGFPTEGGVRVPAIVRFGAAGRRGVDASVVTVKDVAPTLLELAGASHPGSSFEGRPIAPLEGSSMLRFVRGELASVHGGDFTMGFELFGRRALRERRLEDRLALRALRAGPLGALRPRPGPARVARPRERRAGRARPADPRVGRVRRDERRRAADARHGLRDRAAALGRGGHAHGQLLEAGAERDRVVARLLEALLLGADELGVGSDGLAHARGGARALLVEARGEGAHQLLAHGRHLGPQLPARLLPPCGKQEQAEERERARGEDAR